MENVALEEPKGISFFSIKTGETHYCKLEPTIAAYINSSDMGINASRDQDYGWRLGAEWIKRIRAFKRNQTQMAILTAKNSGSKPTTIQILYYMYGEELAAYFESQEEFESPFAEQYQNDISNRTTASSAPTVAIPKALADFQDEDDSDITDLIDDAVLDSVEAPVESELPKTPPTEPTKAKTAKQTQKAR